MTFRKGSVAMITGACGCIGQCTVRQLARDGIKLILCDVNEEPLKALAAEVEAMGAEAIWFAFDVRDASAVAKAVQEGIARFCHVDDLICIAGGSAALINKITTFAESEPSTWDFVMGINVQGTFNCVHAVLPGMIEQKFGRIIIFGSIAGVGGLAKRADYSAAKGALSSFTMALAMEVGQYNITVNCVSPGAIHRGDTPIDGMTYIGEKGQSAGPEPIASMCEYLCSEEAFFITGQNYQVDGGRTLGSR